MGLDFGSKLFRLQPATININQKTTQAEGAIPGKLRITETGQQFDDMTVTLLVMPEERFDYYVGEAGNLNRSKDNLMCFARPEEGSSGTPIRPHKNAKFPQAVSCSTCPKKDWTKWRQTKKKEDIPPCESFYYAVFIDTVYKLPLRMYVRSKARKPFEAGMQELARKLKLMQSQGLNPNIFDIKFKLGTEKILTNNLPSYVPKLSEFKVITDDEKAAFGDIYLNFINQGNRQAEAEAADQIDAANQVIDAEIVADSPNAVNGEIVI